MLTVILGDAADTAGAVCGQFEGAHYRDEQIPELLGTSLGSNLLTSVPWHHYIHKHKAAQRQPSSSGILNLRGSALPYIRLREVFRYSAEIPARENVVVVKVGDFQAGIAVDQLLGALQAVVKPIGKVFRGISGIAGSTILGDGRVGLIIDVPGLLQGVMQRDLAEFNEQTSSLFQRGLRT